MKFKKHIFICTNDKEAPKKCCGSERGGELVAAFQNRLKELGLNTEIRAQKSGCLDACGFGPSMVVYPEGTYYGNIQPADVEEIIQNHLINDTPVERLALSFEKK